MRGIFVHDLGLDWEHVAVFVALVVAAVVVFASVVRAARRARAEGP